MKTLLAIVIPAAGVIAAAGSLGSGIGAALFMLALAVAGFWRFALR